MMSILGSMFAAGAAVFACGTASAGGVDGCGLASAVDAGAVDLLVGTRCAEKMEANKLLA